MIEADQGPIETVDPALGEMLFVLSKQTAIFDFDFGDGWKTARLTPDTVDIQPAYQACGLRLPMLSLRFLTVKAEVIGKLPAEVGAAPTALDAITGSFAELPRARELINRLWSSMNNTGSSGALLTDGLFMTLVGELLQTSEQGVLSVSLPKAGDKRLLRAVDYIEAHLGTELTVGELASVATMSRSGLARAFRAAYGEAVWSYVQGRRILRAVDMLKYTEFPIAQVAELCGFTSQSHLTSAMRSRLGVTPGAVRSA